MRGSFLFVFPFVFFLAEIPLSWAQHDITEKKRSQQCLFNNRCNTGNKMQNTKDIILSNLLEVSPRTAFPHLHINLFQLLHAAAIDSAPLRGRGGMG